MSQRITIPFIGGTNKSRTIAVNNQATVNLMASVKSMGAKNSIILETAPGLVDKGVVGDGPCRTPQMPKWINPADSIERLYGVWGTKLIAIAADLSTTVIGTLTGSSGQARIARGRTHILIVDGDAGYTYDGTTFAAITDLDFPTEQTPAGTVTHCVYLDGFFIVNHKEKDDFYISALEDPTSWNALDFDAASVAPDNALALAATESILYIVGDETMQPYYNSGNADFPYDVYLSGVAEVGIAAPQSIAESDDGVFYLATTPEGGLFVYRLQGIEGSVISGEEQDSSLALQTAASVEAAYGFIYKQEGKSFYILQTATETFVYNIGADQWETRERANGDPWRIAGHGIIARQNIGGSRIDARFYELDLTTFDDAGDTMLKRRVSQIYHKDGMLMDWWQVVIDFQAGVGTASGAGDDPQCQFSYSDDDGETYSQKLSASIGKIGERKTRVVYNNLGQSSARQLEVLVADPVQVSIVNAYAVLEILDD